MVKAVVVSAPHARPEVLDVTLPTLGPGDVRVRIAAAGVCHSDLSMVNGTLAPGFPLILGHEASGVITQVGNEVTRVQPGDRVVLNWAAPCRECWFCRHDEPWLCTAVEGVVSLPGGHLDNGGEVHTCMGIGAFAEEAVLPARSVVPLPDGVPLDLAALLGCAVLTGVGAVRNTGRVRPGESVLIVGLGGIGLSAVLGAKLAGAGEIIAVDLAEEKGKLALAAGATRFLTSRPKLAKEVRTLTGGRGVDHAFECVGTATTIRLAWTATRRGGSCTIVGVGKRDDTVSFNPLELFHFSRNLTSSIYGASDPDRDVPELARHVIEGRLDLAPLVTHRIDLGDVPEAFARMTAGEGARSLIELAVR